MKKWVPFELAQWYYNGTLNTNTERTHQNSLPKGID